MYLAIHQRFSGRPVEAEFWMMTWDIFKTREKVLKKISALWNNMYLAIHQQFSGQRVEAEFRMMTGDILKTREKVPKKISAPTISREGSKKISAPTIVDPISKKILSCTLFLAHWAHKLQQHSRGRKGHIEMQHTWEKHWGSIIFKI
jgi:hypothetical protein